MYEEEHDPSAELIRRQAWCAMLCGAKKMWLAKARYERPLSMASARGGPRMMAAPRQNPPALRAVHFPGRAPNSDRPPRAA